MGSGAKCRILLLQGQIFKVKVALLDLALPLLGLSLINILVNLAFLDGAVGDVAGDSIDELAVRLHLLDLFQIELAHLVHQFEQLLEFFGVGRRQVSSRLDPSDHHVDVV